MKFSTQQIKNIFYLKSLYMMNNNSSPDYLISKFYAFNDSIPDKEVNIHYAESFFSDLKKKWKCGDEDKNLLKFIYLISEMTIPFENFITLYEKYYSSDECPLVVDDLSHLLHPNLRVVVDVSVFGTDMFETFVKMNNRRNFLYE